ncbi:sugar phosphate isomerase/epimerase [Caldibacillus lycopersici]|uniref:Sugar phosphate isomerase/epimerase n=1 Tax=Perspicuibacillus lycopersici TaxID=1325689 RepID=A0AAE3IVR5_9BACI|nr:sugar phosphate isomerase/epimerase [Perspicuibacillus lycopersici]MCU9615107.1 sugar phosphate isomerase/epimerase [Perspicuibacillus lycopersici]
MKNIPVAVQMYTLRDQCAEDFLGTLAKVAELGYDGVEFAGLFGHSPEEVREHLDKLGLKAASSHVPLSDLKTNLAQVIEEQKILGSSYIVCPFLMPDERSEEDYLSLIAFLQVAGEIVEKEGLTLCYHNHDFELERLSDGRTALEAILNDTSPEFLKAEFDIYWLQKSGEQPVEWIKRFKGRTPIVHLKDMTTDEEKAFAELGTGGVDLESVLHIGEEANVQWWVVEQDVCRRNPLESIEMSLHYLKSKLPYLTKA